MTALALYGAGNLMIAAQLVVMYSDELHLPAATQVVLLTIVPPPCVPLFTPMWARMFDAGHVVEFRARQTALGAHRRDGVAIIAMFTGFTPLLWLAAMLFGIATAGATLAPNLGHNGFASLGKAHNIWAST